MKNFKIHQRGKGRSRNFLRGTIAVVLVAAITISIVWPFMRASAAQVTIDGSVASATSTWKLNSNPDTVFISDQVGYAFYRGGSTSPPATNNRCVYAKTNDGGASWGTPVIIHDITGCVHIAVWYDRWTPGDSTGTLIHIATMDTTSDNIYYNTLDTGSGDALGLANTAPIAMSTDMTNTLTAANQMTITKATDGKLYIGVADTGTAGDTTWVKLCASSCLTTQANWTDTSLGATAGTQRDELLLMPLASGNILLIYNETALDDILSKVYTVGTSLWSASFTTVDANAPENTTYTGRLGATLRKSTNDIYIAYTADNATLGTDDDIRTAKYSSGAWTATTNVLTNDASRGITTVKLGLDESNGDLYAVYSVQTTPGTATTGNIYYKQSTNAMSTWGSESAALNTAGAADLYGLKLNIMSNERLFVTWHDVNGASSDLENGSTVVDMSPVVGGMGTQVAIDSAVDNRAPAKMSNTSDTVFISDQVGYVFYEDLADTCSYNKTTDGGATWGSAVSISSSADCMVPAIWYDRWTPGNSGNIIHITTKDQLTGFMYYNQLDTSTDTLSNGTSPVNISSDKTNSFAYIANRHFITEGTNGVLWAGVVDSGGVGDTSWIKKCTGTCNTGSNWVDATPGSFPTAAAANYDLVMMPLASGNMLMILRDTNTDVVESKVYTYGTSTWDASFTSIDAAPGAENTTHRGTLSATVNRSTNDIYLAYVTDNSTLGTDDDIRTAKYSSGSWTAKTNILTNSALGITHVSLSIDESTGDLYTVYSALSTPATVTTGDIFYKSSSDGMTTWGTQSAALNTVSGDLRGVEFNLMSDERIYVTWQDPDGGNPDKLYGRSIVDLVPNTTLTQSAYRWFANLDDDTPIGVFAAETTAASVPCGVGQIRLRMALTVGGATLGATSGQYQVQYSTSTAGPWTNITTSSALFRGFDNPGTADATTLTSAVLTGSPTAQTYSETGLTGLNPNAVASGSKGEWDFSLSAANAPINTYYFRMAKTSGTALNTYTVYPTLTITTAPSMDSVMRGGNFFAGDTEQSYACSFTTAP